MVEKAQDSELEKEGASFADSANASVPKAYAAGIVSGVGDNRFDPATKTNREQIATMLARASSYLELKKDKDITLANPDLSKVTDKGLVSSWTLDGVGILAANGIMKGTSDTTLSPKADCTAEQSILRVYRIYTNLK